MFACYILFTIARVWRSHTTLVTQGLWDAAP